MSETPFFPDPPPFGVPKPRQPSGEEDLSAQALPAMEQHYARSIAWEAAFERLYNRYRTKMLGCALRCQKAKEKAEDLVHDVMIRVMRQDDLSERCPTEQDLENYLMRAMKRRVLDELIAQAKSRETPLALIDSLLTGVSPVDLTAWRAERDVMERFVNRVIWELPERCREVFIARRITGMTPEETAEHLGISVKTVAAHMTRAQWVIGQKLAAAEIFRKGRGRKKGDRR